MRFVWFFLATYAILALAVSEWMAAPEPRCREPGPASGPIGKGATTDEWS